MTGVLLGDGAPGPGRGPPSPALLGLFSRGSWIAWPGKTLPDISSQLTASVHLRRASSGGGIQRHDHRGQRAPPAPDPEGCARGRSHVMSALCRFPRHLRRCQHPAAERSPCPGAAAQPWSQISSVIHPSFSLLQRETLEPSSP